MSRSITKDAAYFHKRTHVASNGCWEWTLQKDRDGYGRVKHEGKKKGAHVVAWLIFKGDKGDQWVLHKCDNPSCCNPEHLFLGDNKSNQVDRYNKGRCGVSKATVYEIKRNFYWTHDDHLKSGTPVV